MSLRRDDFSCWPARRMNEMERAESLGHCWRMNGLSVAGLLNGAAGARGKRKGWRRWPYVRCLAVPSHYSAKALALSRPIFRGRSYQEDVSGPMPGVDPVARE